MSEGQRSVERLVREALELESSEARSAFLDAACAGDDALRKRAAEGVERALQTTGSLGSASGASGGVGLGKGDRIGRYRLIERIGEGEAERWREAQDRGG